MESIQQQRTVRFGEILTPRSELWRSLLFAGPGVTWVMLLLILLGLLLLGVSILSRGDFGQVELPLT